MRTLNCQRNVDVVNIERVIAAMGGNRGPRVDIGGSGDFQHGKACGWSSAGSSLRAAGRPAVMSGNAHAEPRSAQRDVGIEWDLRIRRLNLSLFPIQICLDQGREDNPGTQNASLQLILTRIHLSAKLQVSLGFGKAGSHTAFFWDKTVLITLTTTVSSEEDE